MRLRSSSVAATAANEDSVAAAVFSVGVERRLAPFRRRASKVSRGKECVWSEEDLEALFGPLLGLPVERWPAALADPTLEVYSLGTVPDPDSALHLAAEQMIVAYETLLRGVCVTAGGGSGTVNVALLLPLVRTARRLGSPGWRSDSGAVVIASV